jgi:NAD(P)-dependent dehydrogenase (short-subunit alcohol dehydrogenase family)
VAVTDIRPEWSEQVGKEIRTTGGVAMALKLDVTRKQEVEDGVARIVKKWGHLDIWVNNAGVSTMNRFLELTEKDWDFNLGVNAKGTFFCSQAVAGQMAKQEPDEKRGLRRKIIKPKRVVEIVRRSPLKRVHLILELSHPLDAPDQTIIDDHARSVEAWAKWL